MTLEINTLRSWISLHVHHPAHGYLVIAGLLASLCITVWAGLCMANAQYGRGILLLIAGVLVMKPSLLYWGEWLEERWRRAGSDQRVLTMRKSDG